ncbi:uncharacterized protein LAESUDRAFT_721673 [Laetiporus sulphureus 93-53]|uniref:Uncharacterized protein n=1 Tax=Laetiporus sulphureus 93-53 TaxID=1314785 RepID=A0A165GH09_9APHY|nr:uncharacterized protein LAESUDRAFT_721673 [Laetiporus sulphureus 93-53]KZT10334.1 hypothetical protein LAESUDRAFT_721673 [Laetiporus sulphureus 93-53]
MRHIPYIAQLSTLIFFFQLEAGRDHSPTLCHGLIAYQLGVNQAVTIIVEAILLMRIYALFKQNIMVIISVLVLFTAEIAAMITILALGVPKIEFNSVCLVRSIPSIMTPYWALSLIFETALFALTLYKFLTDYVKGQHSILTLIIRDGTWAYAAIFVAMLVNTLLYRLVHNSLAGLCFAWESAIISTVGSHILLNLRRFGAQCVHSSRSVRKLSEASSISFATPLQRPSHFNHSLEEGVTDGLRELEDFCSATSSDDRFGP